MTESITILENGDRLTRAQFERRYCAMPRLKKAELNEGIVYIPSRVGFYAHSKPHAILNSWLGYYLSRTPGLHEYGNGASVRLDQDNEPQPDLALLLPKRLGGLAHVDEDDYIAGAPTWIGEIAASSVSLDLNAKLNAYRRNSVREYLVWRTEDQAVDWFILREGKYDALAADANGVLKSEQFPGLWLDVGALLKSDLPGLFKAVDEGVSTAEHGEFLKKLRGE